MAEFLSAYPTAGGQYHWVAVISWKEWVPILSWITGWINVSGWIALTASGGLLGSQFVVGVISLYNPVENPRLQHCVILLIVNADIYSSKMAPILDIHWLQYRSFPNQCIHE